MKKSKRLMEPRKSHRNGRLKPTVTGAWSTSEVFQLIQRVQQHPCLWDFSSSEHKSPKIRAISWSSVAKGLIKRHSVDECKAKWSNTKTIYLRVKNKRSAALSAGELPQWLYWSAMQFVEKSATTKDIDDDDDDHGDEDAAATDEPESTGDANGDTQSVSKSSNKSAEPAPYITSVWSIGDEPMMGISASPSQVHDALDVEGGVGESEWQIIANYWALQLRSMATIEPTTARLTHLEMTKVLVEASMAVTQRQFPKTMCDN